MKANEPNWVISDCAIINEKQILFKIKYNNW